MSTDRFINDDFMLTNDYARELYHESAEKMPIIDYHCHLVPKMIADNYQFKDLTEVWLGGDHYKWRAMRGNGVPEEYITDSRSFLSYPRHEYFRRILCNLIGEDVASCKLPESEMAFLHQMVQDISYNNADKYFGF